MNDILSRVIAPSPNAVTPFVRVLRAVQAISPDVRRDAVIAEITRFDGAELVFLGKNLVVTGVVLK